MRKTYIGWWAVSAYLIWRIIRHFLIRDVIDWETAGVFLAASLVCFFIGYRRFMEYQEYQEDRQIRNEYLKGNTPNPPEEQNNKP